MTRMEIILEVQRIADELEVALNGDTDRQYAAEQTLRDLQNLVDHS